MKKYVYWGLFILFVAGSIAAGGPFNLIDIIIVRPIVNVLFVIFNLVRDFGLAIIVFTVLVKVLMLPLTKRQLDQAKLIRKIQPELTKIKENCKGNKQLESLQTMDLYRRFNVKPFSSVITLVIQLPIFIALFSAIRVIAEPMPQDNLMNRAYEIVAYQGSEIKELEDKQEVYIADQENEAIPAEEKATYDFHPMLFGVVDMSARPANLIMGKPSVSAGVILIFAILASATQFWVTKQQMPSGKSAKSKKFRDLIREAKEGKELDESDISNMTTQQMSVMMPVMMFVVMFNLNGALVFYYLLSNIFSLIQQKIVLRHVNEEIDETTDKAVLKKLRQAQEAEVIENKKTGTKITRISAKDRKRGGARGGAKNTKVGAKSSAKGDVKGGAKKSTAKTETNSSKKKRRRK